MPTHIRPDQVPLAVWQLAAEGPTPPEHSPRRRLAELVVQRYCDEAGVVIDIAPLGGEIARAAVDSGRAAVVLATTSASFAPCPVASLVGLAGDISLAAVLPPESALRHGRPFTPSARAVEEAAHHAAGVLRPKGSFVLGLVGSEEGEDSIGQAVEAAGSAGLSYIQHVVALLATGLDDCAGAGARRVAHADVLVFAKGRA